MAKSISRQERVSLRIQTWLKRCGRDPDTGQLLTLAGHRVEDTLPPEHLAALRVHKRRQQLRHMWTPRLQRIDAASEGRDPGDWHALLQDEDTAEVIADHKAAMAASLREMSAARDRAEASGATPPPPLAARMAAAGGGMSPLVQPTEFYLPPTTAARDANGAATDTLQPLSNADYVEALELTDVYLNKDTTHHYSARHLREDNRQHKVAQSQVIRGDGLDKVTSGIPPAGRRAVRPGRADILVTVKNAESGEDQTLVVSRLVSNKQMKKDKASNAVALVTAYSRPPL